VATITAKMAGVFEIVARRWLPQRLHNVDIVRFGPIRGDVRPFFYTIGLLTVLLRSPRRRSSLADRILRVGKWWRKRLSKNSLIFFCFFFFYTSARDARGFSLHRRAGRARFCACRGFEGIRKSEKTNPRPIE